MKFEIIVDHGETANKCTVVPMAGRPDFELRYVGSALNLGRLNAEILLHHQGQCLTTLGDTDKVRSIALVDCVWRRLDPLIARLEQPLPALYRIPDGFVTAYPRRTKDASDPRGGLATIEAIFIASTLVGHWDLSILSKYAFAAQFIEMNRSRFMEFGINQAESVDSHVIFEPPVRNSMQRRIARGRGTGLFE